MTKRTQFLNISRNNKPLTTRLYFILNISEYRVRDREIWWITLCAVKYIRQRFKILNNTQALDSFTIYKL